MCRIQEIYKACIYYVATKKDGILHPHSTLAMLLKNMLKHITFSIYIVIMRYYYIYVNVSIYIFFFRHLNLYIVKSRNPQLYDFQVDFHHRLMLLYSLLSFYT